MPIPQSRPFKADGNREKLGRKQTLDNTRPGDPIQPRLAQHHAQILLPPRPSTYLQPCLALQLANKWSANFRTVEGRCWARGKKSSSAWPWLGVLHWAGTLGGSVAFTALCLSHNPFTQAQAASPHSS